MIPQTYPLWIRVNGDDQAALVIGWTTDHDGVHPVAVFRLHAGPDQQRALACDQDDEWRITPPDDRAVAAYLDR